MTVPIPVPVETQLTLRVIVPENIGDGHTVNTLTVR